MVFSFFLSNFTLSSISMELVGKSRFTIEELATFFFCIFFHILLFS